MTNTLKLYYSGQLRKQTTNALQKTAGFTTNRILGTSIGALLGGTSGYHAVGSKGYLPTAVNTAGGSMLGAALGDMAGRFSDRFAPKITEDEWKLKDWFDSLDPEAQSAILKKIKITPPKPATKTP